MSDEKKLLYVFLRPNGISLQCCSKKHESKPDFFIATPQVCDNVDGAGMSLQLIANMVEAFADISMDSRVDDACLHGDYIEIEGRIGPGQDFLSCVRS